MTAVIDPRSRALLAEAAEWRLLSLLFDCPRQGWLQQLEGLAAEVADPQLQACAHKAREQAGEGLYHSTFGPGGPASPREVSYCDTLQFGYLMSELQTYYDAFGYRPQTQEGPDHIAVEAGFVSFLKMKEAFARTSENKEQAAVTAEAAERFVGEHLARIAQPLAERLTQSGLEYLAVAADALHKRVGAAPECLASASKVALPVLSEDSAFTCGLDNNDEAGQ